MMETDIQQGRQGIEREREREREREIHKMNKSWDTVKKSL